MQPSQAEPAKKQLGYDSLSSCSCLESSPGRLKTWRRSRAPACSWQKVVLQRCWTHCLIIILSSSKLKRGTSSSSIIAELLAWFALPDLSFSWNISCCFGCSLCSLTSRENLIWPATCWHCLFPWGLGAPWVLLRQIKSITYRKNNRSTMHHLVDQLVLQILRQTANLAKRNVCCSNDRRLNLILITW